MARRSSRSPRRRRRSISRPKTGRNMMNLLYRVQRSPARRNYCCSEHGQTRRRVYSISPRRIYQRDVMSRGTKKYESRPGYVSRLAFHCATHTHTTPQPPSSRQ